MKKILVVLMFALFAVSTFSWGGRGRNGGNYYHDSCGYVGSDGMKSNGYIPRYKTNNFDAMINTANPDWKKVEAEVRNFEKDNTTFMLAELKKGRPVWYNYGNTGNRGNGMMGNLTQQQQAARAKYFNDINVKIQALNATALSTNPDQNKISTLAKEIEELRVKNSLEMLKIRHAYYFGN
ncbi:MAG: hypothetical protein ACRCSK_05180 [Fusobacteriaceae bacterium]